MFRFIAFAWNSADQNQSALARRLAHSILDQYGPSGEAMLSDGLAVCWSGARARSNEHQLLSESHGVVLGRLFPREYRLGQREGLDAGATRHVLESQGRHLICNYWGRYVAFIRDAASDRTWVLRDPTGTLPCFMTSIDEVSIFFSRIDDCIRLGATFTVNWSYVLTLIAATPNEKLDRTGLNEVETLHGGECFERHGNVTRRQFYWDPFSIAGANIIEDPVEAAKRLRQTVRNCVNAWASCYDGIAHRLSGGLDSSIVACCLSDAPTRPLVTCFNHHSPGADTDERAYARLMATRAGYELVEHEREATTRFEQLRQIVRSPHPFYIRYSIDYSRFEAALAQKKNAGAIFSGEWGDALFQSSPQEMLSAIDCARLKGIGFPLFRACLDTARLEGKVYWRVLWRAIATGLLSSKAPDPRRNVLEKYRPLLARDAASQAASDTCYLHPWLKAAHSAPPGKRWHIYESVLLDLHPFYDLLGHEEDPDQVAPLNSQPIVELCLQIPTHILLTGAWDRAIARRAFLEDLPREIAARRTKGGVEAYQRATVDRNIDYMRDSLLNGALVNEGLLDRSALKQVLSGEPTRIASSLNELYWYLCTEAWISPWIAGHRAQLGDSSLHTKRQSKLH